MVFSNVGYKSHRFHVRKDDLGSQAIKRMIIIISRSHPSPHLTISLKNSVKGTKSCQPKKSGEGTPSPTRSPNPHHERNCSSLPRPRSGRTNMFPEPTRKTSSAVGWPALVSAHFLQSPGTPRRRATRKICISQFTASDWRLKCSGLPHCLAALSLQTIRHTALSLQRLRAV